MSITLLSFCLSFIHWYKFDGYSEGFGPYGRYGDGALSDVNALMVIVQIFLIINIVVFALYILTGIINFGALVPQLRNVDLHRILHIVYYSVLAFCIVFGLIGALVGGSYTYPGITFDYDTTIAGGWIVSLIFMLLGIVFVIKKDLISALLRNAAASGSQPGQYNGQQYNGQQYNYQG